MQKNLAKKLLSWKLPRLYFGFPVADVKERAPTAGEEGTARHKEERQKGIALLIAIMFSSIMMLFTIDLITSSQVNVTLADHTKNNVKAEYVAKSGMNVAMLLLSSDLAYQLFVAQQDPKSGLASGLGDIWTAMNDMPIGGESAEMLDKFQKEFGLNKVMDSDILDTLKMFEGSFTIKISDEAQKININDCYNGKCSQVMLMLEAMFSCPAEKMFLEQKKLTPEELAYRIKDYIKKDPKADEQSGYNDKNEPYQRRLPKQMAKAAPLDSVEELRMVEGWDSDLQAVFAPFITTFPLQHGSTDSVFQMNINTAQRGLLQCLFPESKGDCAEKVAQALQQRDEEGINIGGPTDKVGDVLKNVLCYAGGDQQSSPTTPDTSAAAGQSSSTSSAAGAGQANDRSSWFKKYSMTYRIEVEGVVGGSVKHLTAIIERIVPDQKKNQKNAFRLLYWKMS